MSGDGPWMNASAPPPTEGPAKGPPGSGPASPENSYDAVPYSVNAFPQTTPDRLAVIGTLFGMNPAAPARCRVLELGCASGGNLLPMASMHPGSEFVGIDLSGRQIEEGRAVVRELGLTNLDLRHVSILDIGPDFGPFDYILAHGVYSWVPPEVQEKILAVCRDHLAPQGIAYISYNTYPGWHARAAIREMLWYHTEHLTDPQARVQQARGLLAFMAKTLPAQAAYNTLLSHELLLLLRTPDTYLLHEHLEAYNEPLYFHQFAGRLMEKGLQYLGEAHLGAMMPNRFGEEAERTLRAMSPDLLHMEQYMDFLRNRMFRQSLACRGDVELGRALNSASVERFYVASPAKPAATVLNLGAGVEETFSQGGEAGPKLKTTDPLMKAAMAHLGERWPVPMRFESLLAEAYRRVHGDGGTASLEEVRQLATRLLNAYASNLLEFSLSAPAFVGTVSERPVASPYVRLRARQADKVTNLRLESIAITDATRLVLTHLDGEYDRRALIELVARWAAAQASGVALLAVGGVTESARERATRYVDEILQAFARGAVLIA